MAKGGQKQTTTQNSGLTGGSLGMQNGIYKTAQDAANNYKSVGVNDASQQALGGYQGMMQAGQNGLAALGGDQAAMGKLMNPYQSQVIDQMQSQYGRASTGLEQRTSDEATRAGAFGGSRHGVASGVAQAGLGQAHEGNMANLLQSGYQNAQGVAGQLANMGLAGTQGAAGMGEYLRDVEQEQANPGAAKLGLLNAGMAGGGQASSNQSQTTRLPGTSALQNIAGIASIGAGLFGGPLGGAAGGVLGKLAKGNKMAGGIDFAGIGNQFSQRNPFSFGGA